MNVIIFNNNGVGNGIIVYPLLKALEDKGIRYFHQENAYLRYRLENLPEIAGFFPDIWRRFQNPDETFQFIENQGIEAIFNGRKEDVNFDPDYLKFRDQANARGLKVYDLYAENIDNDLPIGVQIMQMFKNCFGPLGQIKWEWIPQKQSEYGLLVYIGSKNRGKTLPVGAAKLIYHGIRSVSKNLRWVIATGKLEHERQAMSDLEAILPHDHLLSLKVFESFEDAEDLCSRSGIVLTTDTYMSHLAGAVGISTYTIFLRTIGRIWRHNTQNMNQVIQSPVPVNCQYMKLDGTCRHFYSECFPCDGYGLDFFFIGQQVARESFSLRNEQIGE